LGLAARTVEQHPELDERGGALRLRRYVRGGFASEI
jgi:hypothetical protein